MTGWIITGAVLAFFALVLATSIKCRVYYDGEKVQVWVGFWMFWFSVFPQKKEDKKEKISKKKREEDSSKQQEHSKKKDKLDFGLIKNLLGAGIKGLKIIWRHLIFYNLRLKIIVGHENAAECALRYGKLCSFVYGGIATGKNLANIHEREISLSCDFSKNRMEYDIDASAKIQIVFLLGAAFRMLFYLVVHTIKNNGENRKV